MSLRAEQKEQTKHAIMNAALRSLSADRAYGSLSLREVARAAEIAPTSFYRHFKDLDDLGVHLAKEVAETLVALVRKGREQMTPEKNLVRSSVDVFLSFLREEPAKFRFLMREKSGSSLLIRQEIKKLTRDFISELSDFLVFESRRRNKGIVEPEIVAECLVNIVFNMGPEFLDSPAEKTDEIYERLVKQLTLVSIGAEARAQSRAALRQ